MSHERLHAYFDGELGPDESAALEEALGSDPGLAAELERLQALDRALETLPGHRPSQAFTRRVLEAAARRRRAARLLRILAPLAAAAALALAVFLPRPEGSAGSGELFSTEEYLGYVWENDAEAFGSLAISDLEDAILAELEVS